MPAPSLKPAKTTMRISEARRKEEGRRKRLRAFKEDRKKQEDVARLGRMVKVGA